MMPRESSGQPPHDARLQYEAGAVDFIQLVRGFARCDWCGREGKKNPRGLCRSCDRVRKEVEVTEADIQERSIGGTNFLQEWKVQVPRQMKQRLPLPGERF